MIFPIIDVDLLNQVGEKVRIDASKSFITQDESAITLVEIEPNAGDGFITVFTTSGNQSKDKWFVDWVYSTVSSKTISLRITTDGAPTVVTKDTNILAVADDALFASDNDLKTIESDIMKWLPAGKSTWNFVHRKVQDRILTEIYKSRILALDGTKLTKAEVIDKAEVREWATYLALSMIYGQIQNASSDVFLQKSKSYESKAESYKNYTLNVLKLDYDKSGVIDEDTEKLDFRSGGLVRR